MVPCSNKQQYISNSSGVSGQTCIFSITIQALNNHLTVPYLTTTINQSYVISLTDGLCF